MEEFRPQKTLGDLSLILAISLISIAWFRGDNLINIGDFCFPMARKIYLNISMFLWDHSISMGYPAAGQLGAIFPYSLLGYLTEVLGFSLVFFEKTMFFLWFSVSGLGMYAFCAESGLSRPARIFAALFYMMNPYALLVPWHLASGLLIAGYSMTPLLMFLLARMLRSGKFSDWGVMFLVWFALGTYSYMNQAVAVVHLLLLGGYACFRVLISARTGGNFRRQLLLSGLLFMAWFAASAYWLMPFLQGIASQSIAASNSSMGFASNLDTFRLNSAPLAESIRLHGLWSMYGFWRPWTPYYAWAAAYKAPLLVLLSFLPTFFIVVGFLLSEKRHQAFLLFSALLLLVTLFMMKGIYPPLSSVNLWLNDHLPFFGTAFRAGYQKWGLISSFAFCCLAGYGLGTILEVVHSRDAKLSWGAGVISGILLFVVYMFPFWNGQVIFSGGGIIPDARMKLPAGYQDLYGWTKGQPGEFRIFSLPLSRNSNTIYKWGDGGYSGADFIRFFSDKPVIYANYGFYYDLPLYIGEKIEKREYKGLLPLLALMNVRYLLVHTDINWTAIKELNWWVTKDKAAVAGYSLTERALNLKRDFGPFKIYRLPEKFDSPQLYASKAPEIFRGGTDGLARLLDKDAAVGPRLFIAEEDLLEGKLPKAPANPLPELFFRRINPARYEVTIRKASGPFWLVLGETYHSGWKVFRGRGHGRDNVPDAIAKYPRYNVSEGSHSISPTFADLVFAWKKPLPTMHLPANTFANAWYVDPSAQKLGDAFTVEIFFLPQSMVYLGLLLAGIMIIVSIILAGSAALTATGRAARGK